MAWGYFLLAGGGGNGKEGLGASVCMI